MLILLSVRLTLLRVLISLPLLVFLLFVHLLLISYYLRPALVFMFPLGSQFLSLLHWSWVVALYVPSFLPFPISVVMPASPILLKFPLRNTLIIPWVSLPLMVSVVFSPMRIYIIIETRHVVIINPTTVIITRSIPTALPWTPPPAIPEKDVNTYVWNNVHIARIRQYHHVGWRTKFNGRWQRYSDMTFVFDRFTCSLFVISIGISQGLIIVDRYTGNMIYFE